MSDTEFPSCDGAGLRIQDFDAAVFDLDGVVTRTARVHAASWKRLFDEYLRRRADETGKPFRPFDIENDYRRYVDGKPRYDGVASFLESRGISLPRGDPSDPPARETICGLGNRKNQYFHDSLKQDGVEVFESTVALIRRLREGGVKMALVSSSGNARAVLDAAGLADLFDVCIDGNDAVRLGLKGKPRPDLFLVAAERLGAEPDRAMVLEDSISGVQAGRAGGFALVVGVDRAGQAAQLRKNGADLVVPDLATLQIRTRPTVPCQAVHAVPRILDLPGEIGRLVDGLRVAVFLDYDGTLTPIVERPDQAILSQDMRAAVKALAQLCTVGIISGRDRSDVERLVGLEDLVYAGSHGFDIFGPRNLKMEHKEGVALAAVVRDAAERLAKALAEIEGALVEPKRFAVAVHYRQVAADEVSRVEDAVDRVLAELTELRKTFGKKVFELRPHFDWDKGKAVLWVLKALKLDGSDVVPLYLGDDTTDEDAFAALADRGVGILVGCPGRETAARYVLDGPEDVQRFLWDLATILKERGHV
ncbi:MAG TPA: trehalose-phosphatase [Alphaproteobacteria bacterium]|nr:trehalose-phosphatase [Alphaproteobacteria bacterium]